MWYRQTNVVASSAACRGGELTNGDVKAVATANHLVVSRVSDGMTLLSGPLPSFADAECGSEYRRLGANFTTSGGKWYGMGQLASPAAGITSGWDHHCPDPPDLSMPSWMQNGDTFSICVLSVSLTQKASLFQVRRVVTQRRAVRPCVGPRTARASPYHLRQVLDIDPVAVQPAGLGPVPQSAWGRRHRRQQRACVHILVPEAAGHVDQRE